MKLSSLKWWIRHPRMFVNRIFAEIYKQQHPGEPWISHHAVRFCETMLSQEMTGLEWGSGRSTAWYARRLKHLTSVEHSPQWYEIVRKQLTQKHVFNVDYRLIPLDHPEEEGTHRTYDPMPQYVLITDRFAEKSLHFVVIDGHYRMACVHAAIGKIRPGGFLLIDNTSWMALHEWGVPGDWEIVHRSQGFEGETTIWRRPIAGILA